jgi:hypothetical protein
LSKDRLAYQIATADATGVYTAGNPYQYYSDSTCATSTRTETFNPNDTGRTYLTHIDGNQVFAAWGGPFGPLNVNENENVAELYLYPTQGIDWYSSPTVTTTVTLAPVTGAPATFQQTSSGQNIKVSALFTNGPSKVLIRAGAAITATYSQGPPGGPTQPATIKLSSVPLITGSPDIATNTVAGVGPKDWIGQATLNPPPSANLVSIPTRTSTAYSPLTFRDSNNVPVQLVFGYSGVIGFIDGLGNRVWSAWAVTANPVKITGNPRPGDTLVCGKATPGFAIQILDVTNQPLAISIGSGVADGQGNFCVTVNPALYLGQVILAQDSNGTLSQPAVVRIPVFLPAIPVN